MAGYSETPLPQKLGIPAGSRLALLGAPDPLPEGLRALPEDVEVRTSARGGFDVIVCFVGSRGELERRFGVLERALRYDGGLWIAWPKRASGVRTDMTEDAARELALARGLVDNKVCAIDETWSGLRLVYRLRDRPA